MRLHACGVALLLGVMGCQVSPYDAYGKLCTTADVCPSPLRCVASRPGASPRCLHVAEFQDGVSADGGYAGTRDAFASQNVPDQNFGTAPEDDVDGNEPTGTGRHNLSFVSWDVSALPAATTLLGGSIVLDITNSTATGVYQLSGLKRPWVETEVTWNQAALNRPWKQPGAASAQDRGDVIGHISPPTPGFLTVDASDAGLVLFQSWVADITTNAGVVIDGSTSDGIDFDSRRSAYALQHPKLVLVY